MAWDKDQPAGSLQVRQVDDAIRTNNTAIETAFDAEHDFTTEGTQTGQHHFNKWSAAVAATNLLSSVDGRVYFNSSDVAGAYSQYIKHSGAWTQVGPGDPWTRRTANQNWTLAQYGTRTAINPAGGPPLEFCFFWLPVSGSFMKP